MAVTLEKLLTHPKAFGLVTASPVQRACCRVADGLPLSDLACDEAVVRSIGGVAGIDALPRVPPKELYLVSAIRCGKSLFSAALACRAALTIDLSRLGLHEVARVSVVSLDRDKARVVKDHLMGALERDGGVLRRYLVRETAERVLLRRDDGRLVEIVIAAGRRAGGSLVSYWTIAAIFDEAARMLGKADGAVNFDDMRQGVIARLGLLPGAQLVAVTSPWAARGPIYDAVEEDFGRPSEARVVIRATGPDMCPANWTPEACEAERVRPDGAYETDVLGQFVDPEAGFLTDAQIRFAMKDGEQDMPHEIGPSDEWEYTAAMDPAVVSNAWTLVIVGRKRGETDADDQYRLVVARQWQGSRQDPLKARVVFGEIAPVLRVYGLSRVHTDRWSAHMIAEHGDYAGVTVEIDEDTEADRQKRFADFRIRALDGSLKLVSVPAVRADLMMVKKKLQPGGAVRHDLGPVTRDGRHADFAPAAVLAVARAASAPSWVFAMKRMQATHGA